MARAPRKPKSTTAGETTPVQEPQAEAPPVPEPEPPPPPEPVTAEIPDPPTDQPGPVFHAEHAQHVAGVDVYLFHAGTQAFIVPVSSTGTRYQRIHGSVDDQGWRLQGDEFLALYDRYHTDPSFRVRYYVDHGSGNGHQYGAHLTSAHDLGRYRDVIEQGDPFLNPELKGSEDLEKLAQVVWWARNAFDHEVLARFAIRDPLNMHSWIAWVMNAAIAGLKAENRTDPERWASLHAHMSHSGDGRFDMLVTRGWEEVITPMMEGEFFYSAPGKDGIPVKHAPGDGIPVMDQSFMRAARTLVIEGRTPYIADRAPETTEEVTP